MARALLQNAAFKLLLQQDAAAIGAVGDAFDLPEDLQRWLLSCPRGDGLLLARGYRFPVRIEATPEETAVIEWRPGSHRRKERRQGIEADREKKYPDERRQPAKRNGTKGMRAKQRHQ